MTEDRMVLDYIPLQVCERYFLSADASAICPTLIRQPHPVSLLV
jgi:hypothetical protein